MEDVALPFNPLRERLYETRELFEGFSAADPDSYARCPDIAILRYFARYAKNPTTDPRASTLEALHDNAISHATQEFLKPRRKVVAIMGGHDMKRGTATYVGTAHLAHALSREGCLLVSGGGPGGMEAVHVGASFAAQSIRDLDAAVERLATVADLPPDAKYLIRDDGTINRDIARALHRWCAPAVAIAEELGSRATPSLGIPTWLYGFEPTTPFATHVAKYFQNSIREDGLVSIGLQGIVFVEGSAGTVQEIFQDAAKNFYGVFHPMVFLSASAAPGHQYWERAVPVRHLIEALLGQKKEFPTAVLFTDSVEHAVQFLQSKPRISSRYSF